MVMLILDGITNISATNAKCSKKECVEAVLLYIEHIIKPTDKILGHYGICDNKIKWYYLPQYGKYQIEKIEIMIERVRQNYRDYAGQFVDLVQITMIDQYHDNFDHIEKFLTNAFNYDTLYRSGVETETIGIYTYQPSGFWKNNIRTPKRSDSTIYLNIQQKMAVYKTIDRFLTETEEYTRLGIPYKLNLLFEGIPGMGKTSLSNAIASKYGRNIYVINFTGNMNDISLSNSISEIPSDSILLLEDIDCLFVERKTNDTSSSNVTFSGLLNVLDGQLSKQGLITILTTNFVDRLDRALKRPGRIDLIVHFDYATEEQINEMFLNFYPNQYDWFNSFMESIKDIKITMATLQQFFFYVVGKHENPNNFIRQLRSNFGECEKQGVQSTNHAQLYL